MLVICINRRKQKGEQSKLTDPRRKACALNPVIVFLYWHLTKMESAPLGIHSKANNNVLL